MKSETFGYYLPDGEESGSQEQIKLLLTVKKIALRSLRKYFKKNLEMNGRIELILRRSGENISLSM